jgi:hypothetical protein
MPVMRFGSNDALGKISELLARSGAGNSNDPRRNSQLTDVEHLFSMGFPYKQTTPGTLQHE